MFSDVVRLLLLAVVYDGCGLLIDACVVSCVACCQLVVFVRCVSSYVNCCLLYLVVCSLYFENCHSSFIVLLTVDGCCCRVLVFVGKCCVLIVVC